MGACAAAAGRDAAAFGDTGRHELPGHLGRGRVNWHAPGRGHWHVAPPPRVATQSRATREAPARRSGCVVEPCGTQRAVPFVGRCANSAASFMHVRHRLFTSPAEGATAVGRPDAYIDDRGRLPRVDTQSEMSARYPRKIWEGTKARRARRAALLGGQGAERCTSERRHPPSACPGAHPAERDGSRRSARLDATWLLMAPTLSPFSHCFAVRMTPTLCHARTVAAHCSQKTAIPFCQHGDTHRPHFLRKGRGLQNRGSINNSLPADEADEATCRTPIG